MSYFIGKKFYLIVSLIVFSCSNSNFAQTKTNLDIFYSLVDSSAAKIINTLPDSSKVLNVELDVGNEYSVFGNRLISDLASHGLQIKLRETGNGIILRYAVEHAEVNYPDMFRSGFLGAYHLKRNISLNGNFILSGDKTLNGNFSYAHKDTVILDSIKEIENSGFPFTKGEIPPEPFFSSLLEPAVAIGAAATAVVLFFTIRSK